MNKGDLIRELAQSGFKTRGRSINSLSCKQLRDRLIALYSKELLLRSLKGSREGLSCQVTPLSVNLTALPDTDPVLSNDKVGNHA